MGLIQPDLTEALDFSPIENGSHHARIEKADVGKSKKNNDVIKLELAVTPNGQDKPRTRKPSIPISGPGAYSFEQLLRATGFADLAEKLKAGEKLDFDTDKLVGQELIVVIEQQLYTPTDASGNPTGEARTTDQIKGYLPK